VIPFQILDESTINIDVWVDEGPKITCVTFPGFGNTKYNQMCWITFWSWRKGMCTTRKTLENALSYNPNGADIRSLYMDDGLPVLWCSAGWSQGWERLGRPWKSGCMRGARATISKWVSRVIQKRMIMLSCVKCRQGRVSYSARMHWSGHSASWRSWNILMPKNFPECQPPARRRKSGCGIWGWRKLQPTRLELSGGWGYGRIIGDAWPVVQ